MSELLEHNDCKAERDWTKPSADPTLDFADDLPKQAGDTHAPARFGPSLFTAVPAGG
jgi:hypothetical protein